MLHVAYINSCRPDDGRWTTETCRHVEFYNDIPVIYYILANINDHKVQLKWDPIVYRFLCCM
jgi:hypothetical protein